MWEGANGKRRIVATTAVGANSEAQQRGLPATNVVSMCPTHNIPGSCTVAHDSSLTSIDVRFDLNAILDGLMEYEVLEKRVLMPILKFISGPC